MVAVIKGGCGCIDKKPAKRDFAMPQTEREMQALVWIQEQLPHLNRDEIKENFPDLAATARSFGLY